MTAILSARLILRRRAASTSETISSAGLENFALDEAACERFRHVAAADKAELLHFGRSPKTARPTRTIVAPSSIATSKSSVIPIESSLSARPVVAASRSRKRAQLGKIVSRTGCAFRRRRNRHQPEDFHFRRAPHRSAIQRRSLPTPDLLGSPPRLTSINTRIGGEGCACAIASASRAESSV